MPILVPFPSAELHDKIYKCVYKNDLGLVETHVFCQKVYVFLIW
jgi:hypothetical protein